MAGKARCRGVDLEESVTDCPSGAGTKSEKLRDAALRNNPRKPIFTSGKVSLFLTDNPIGLDLPQSLKLLVL